MYAMYVLHSLLSMRVHSVRATDLAVLPNPFRHTSRSPLIDSLVMSGALLWLVSLNPAVDPIYRPFLPGARRAGCTCVLELASTSGSSLRAALADMFSACPRHVRVYMAQRSESLRS